MLFISRACWSYRSLFISGLENTSRGKWGSYARSAHWEPETETQNDLHKIIPPKMTTLLGKKHKPPEHLPVLVTKGPSFSPRCDVEGLCPALQVEERGDTSVFLAHWEQAASWMLKVDDDFWGGGIIGNRSQEQHSQRRQHSPEELGVSLFGFNMHLDATTMKERCSAGVCSSHRDREEREREQQKGRKANKPTKGRGAVCKEKAATGYEGTVTWQERRPGSGEPGGSGQHLTPRPCLASSGKSR